MGEHQLRQPNDRPKAEGTAALKFASDTGSSPAPDPPLGLAPTLAEVNLDTPTLAEGTSAAGGRPGYSSELNSEPILRPGAVLGRRYEILQLLGEGGMGSVYRARDREVNRMVALKVIRPELTGNPAILERFKQELVLSHQVTHKNVIRIYDLGDADGVKFITMEFVEGQDLRTLIQEKKKFSPEEAVEITQQICRALEATHSVGVIHRDLKPQNIMRDKNGRILLMDFGLARMVEGDGMTQTGALVGTMEYMSPEQALGKNLDERSDLFTLGLIFYELLTGKMPFTAPSALASLIKRTQERAAPISDHDNSIPGAVSAIVSKCLERDANLRYKSSRELLADLEGWQGKTAAATLHFPDVRRWAPTAWPWIGMALSILVLAFVGIRYRDKLFAKTTQQVGVKPEVSLAILPFHNASGDTSLNWLGTSLADILSTDVGQSARLRTISPDRMHQVLADLRVAPDASLDPITLRRLAEYSNADTLVSGQYARFGDQIRIDATLQDLKHDRHIPLKVEAANEKDIPGAIDRLADNIRQNLLVSPDVMKELRASSFQATSKSLAALRDYNEGLTLVRQGKNLDAVNRFERAVKEDPEFALAYSTLALTYADLARDNDAEQASRKAVDLSQNLSAREKYIITAAHARITKNYAKAIEAYENLGKVASGDADVQSALARLYEDSGSLDKARDLYAKILQADPKNSGALLASGRVEILGNNPGKALDPLNRALSLTIQIDNQEQKSLVVHLIGIAYSQLNKPDEALRNYQQALEIRRRLGIKNGVANTLQMMAQVYDGLGKSDLALKNYNEALQVRRDIGDKQGTGNVLIDLGQFYDDRGKYDEALKLFKEALQIQRDVGNETYQALCLNNIGNSYLFKADYENARTYFEQALQLREKLKIPANIADTLHNLAETSLDLGQYDDALHRYLRALDLRRSADDKRGAAMESDSIGALFEYQGRYGAAVSAKEDALKIYQEVQDHSFWMAEVLSSYGDALSQAGRLEEGRKRLAEGLGLARELKNQALIAQSLGWEGDNYLYSGDLQAAQPLYEGAMRLAAKATDQHLSLASKFRLAKLAIERGTPQKAVSDLKALAGQADTLGLQYLSVECALSEAEGLLKIKEYSRAQQRLDEVLGRSEKLGLRPLLLKSHFLLGTLFRLTGKGSDAVSHYQQAARLLDEMRKEPGTEKLLQRADLKTVYTESTTWSQSVKK